ncbi:MAG: DUF559 domain-containing protein [Actinomycetia bacterium]|nr:DUF559 domain-containing protein [Actinomycetes bacterium]
MNVDADLYAVAAIQGGVIRRSQAFEAGLTRHQIDSRVKAGRWVLIVRGGYRLIELAGEMELVRAAAAVLPSAVVSHSSAARIHRMSFVPIARASVTVHASKTHKFSGVRVVRGMDMKRAHVEDWGGLVVTTVARTAFDLAGDLSQRHLAVIVDEALASRRATLDELDDVLRDVERKGKPGVRAMRSVLNARTGSDPRQTKLERIGLQILKSGGLPSFEVEHPIPWRPDRRYDVAFVPAQVAIEWDSFRWHSQERVFQSDRERDREAIEHGWRVLRFTWKDVTESPDSVLHSVRRLLALPSPG